MSAIAQVLALIAALLAVLVGLRYFTAPAFMPYQSRASGKSWDQLEPGMQAIVLAMLRVVGGAFASLGVSLAWCALALHQGARWAPFAILTVGAAALLPALFATTSLSRFRPEAKPPTAPVAAAIGLIALSAAFALLA